MTKPYVISSIKNVLISATANTTASRYPALEWVAFRKFGTRAEARAYKQSRKNPQGYAIIDTRTQHVVR